MAGWITTDDVLAAGISSTTTWDTDWLSTCVDAANAWAYNERRVSNYGDDPDTVPDDDVKLGVILLAIDYYDSRGGGDAPASYGEFAGAPSTGASFTKIKGLLHVPRPSFG